MKRIAFSTILFLLLLIDLATLTQFHASGIYYCHMRTAQHVFSSLIVISK